jgi:hypothetical protein
VQRFSILPAFPKPKMEGTPTAIFCGKFMGNGNLQVLP